jgi:hypothetical protein
MENPKMKKVLVLMLVMVLCLSLTGTGLAADGQVLYEFWMNIVSEANALAPGGFMGDLLADPRYPDSPTSSWYETQLDMPDNDPFDHYGAQFTGYIIPPATAYYTFWIASDNDGELWLTLEEPKKIACMYGYAPYQGYDTGTYTPPPVGYGVSYQKSVPIPLVAGEKYYVMVRYTDDTMTGDVSVAWQGGSIVDREVVGTAYLTTPDMPPPDFQAVLIAPADEANNIPLAGTTLTWSAPASPPAPVSHYDVYLSDNALLSVDPNHGTGSAAYLGSVSTGHPCQIATGALACDTFYYWRVDTVLTDNRVDRTYIRSFETVHKLPVITTQPQDALLKAGLDAHFTIVAMSPGGNPLYYKWYKKGSATVLSSTTALTVPSVSVANEGLYYCDVNNAYGVTTSFAARLDVQRLIAHWTLDTADVVDPNIVLDSVDNHKGIVYGGTASGMVVGGIVNQAVKLDGVDDYIAVGPVDINGLRARTIAVWAKASTTTIPLGTNVFGFSGSGNNLSFNINANAFGTGEYGMHVFGWAQSLGQVDTEWHHFAGTYDGTTIIWYADGKYLGAEKRVLNTVDNVQMGKHDYADNYFPGAIDDARIYNYALDPVDVALLYYNATGNPVCAGPKMTGDLNGDCKVTLYDFAIFANAWTECNIYPDCVSLP